MLRIYKNELYFIDDSNPKKNFEWHNIYKNNPNIVIKFRETQKYTKYKLANKKNYQSFKKICQENNIPSWIRDKIEFYYLDNKLVAIEYIGEIESCL